MSTPKPTTPRRTKATVASKSTNGAVTAASTVKGIVTPDCPAAPRRSPAVGHQTHGAVTLMSGPITNVSQLVNGGRNVAKGSVGSFETMAEYGSYLRGLSLHDLHRHAVEDARMVPIDDRDRLIRRLETEWTATAARYPGRANSNPIPARTPFTREQIEAQAAIKNRLLKT